MKTIGILLAGSGVFDGSEIREATLALMAIDKILDGTSYDVVMMAPAKEQYHVINHFTGDIDDGPRDVLSESARIARGLIRPLNELDATDIDALIIPGGFGVAKNLCQFAFDGVKGSVDPIVADYLKEAHRLKRPIGAICIAPVLVAMSLKLNNLRVTVGDDKEVMKALESIGVQSEVKTVTEICLDEENKIVSTPAYMYGDAKLHKIYEGIEKLVEVVVRNIP